ncbi:tail fiber domain-containing protein [Hymenobacter armeniacus]|uniref:Tail fiber domain-containing protein n=1 Tax=Hymenobacter armeniacus TaxID=2771358 RepID=A0ABR8JTP8_9BACT|nr:tail fiber domain-containing protein [Hymenobacter armeniacus]MBD2723351.1 tail fiber domain-containing protein [Hymenobacter armeniacus]
MKHLYLLATGLLLATAAAAQTGSVGIGTASPAPQAALDISATGKGLLIPRMDSATRAGIAAPPDGLMVFQTDGRKGFWYCVGGAWLYIPDKTRSGDNLGNHTATRNLNLGGNRLVGGTAAAPGTVGLRIDGNGLVRLAAAPRPFGVYDNAAGLYLTDVDAGFLVRTSIGYGSTTPPASGLGDRLMWTPYYGSFRAGGVDGNQWDGANMGFYSAAFGYNNLVAGIYSLAAGYNNNVRGNYATCLGRDNAIDQLSSGALVIGRNCRAKGNYNLVGGLNSKVQGNYSVALGERCTANAANAIALGRFASANGRSGTFVIADATGNDSLRASANNQFSARYAGGYRLFTNAAMTVGVSLAANGGNAWQVISDSTKKERRRLADGNQFLARIDGMRLGSWNYKGQDPSTMRHYGPMAQDFYAAFGHDGVGTIGNDTTINQSDFDGVNLIAIQALYRRVRALEAENAALRRQQSAPAAQAGPSAAALEVRLRRLEALVGGQAQR